MESLPNSNVERYDEKSGKFERTKEWVLDTDGAPGLEPDILVATAMVSVKLKSYTFGTTCAS